MRKQDIRAGVAYAYRRGSYGGPEPCVLVSTDLYAERGRYDHSGPPCKPALEGAKPGRNYLRERVGYPALRRDYGDTAGTSDADLIALMLTVTPEALTSGEVPDGLRLEILTSLTPLLGPWDEVKSAHDADKARKAERIARDAARRARDRDQAEAVLRVLAGHGIMASYDAYSALPQIVLHLDEAEKLKFLALGQSHDPACGHCDSDRMREVPS